MRAAARKVRGTVARARTLAATGKNEGYAGWNPTDRTVEAGIEIDATGYHLFVDRNSANNGDEAIIEVIDFAAGMPLLWSWTEGPPTVLVGLLYLWLAKRAR